MSGNGYERVCPNCDGMMSMYADHKPYDMVSGMCQDCGFYITTKTGQVSLVELNTVRKESNEDNGYKPGDGDYLPQLKKKPTFKEI